MKNTYDAILGLTVVALIGSAGCATNDARGSGETDAPVEASSPEAIEIALRVERAVQAVELGRDLPAAQRELEALLAVPALSSEQRDDVTLALSRAIEAKDPDRAASLVEEMMARHSADETWRLEEAAERALRRLLTGQEQAKESPQFDDAPVAPIAVALARTFEPRSDGRYAASQILFGSRPGVSDRLGTFNIGGALRKIRADECPLCDQRMAIMRDDSRYGSWVDIPRTRGKMETALTVFYFDLDSRRIPARYDALMPMKSADVVARLEKGEGVVAARTRPDAPPVILLAAPRAAQLADVEEALAGMSELPKEPKSVDVSPDRRPEEIQHAMRSARIALSDCYKTLLAQEPAASGKVVMAFTIEPDGSTTDASLDAATTLTDPALERCVLGVVRGMRFPRAPGKTTIKYPIAMTP